MLAEKIRQLSQESDKLGGNERIASMIEQYFHLKDQVSNSMEAVQFDRDELTKQFHRLNQSEASLVSSRNASFLNHKIEQMELLLNRVLSATIPFLIHVFLSYKTADDGKFKDARTARKMIAMADKALEEEKYHEFRMQVFGISALLLHGEKLMNKEFKGTGIG